LPAFFLGEQLVLQDFLAAQLVAPMHQRDVAGDVRQVERFLDGGIAAADDRHRLVAVEEAVAGGASGNPAPANSSSEGRPRYCAERRWR
jgi:hypothetical protein